MSKMFNPPHPGEVLRDYLGDVTVTDAAKQLGVNRVTLNRIVSGHSGISPDMAYRLADAFGTSAELWQGCRCSMTFFKLPNKSAHTSLAFR